MVQEKALNREPFHSAQEEASRPFSGCAGSLKSCGLGSDSVWVVVQIGPSFGLRKYRVPY